MGRVLLLEDHDAFCLRFEPVYGDRLDHCYTVGQMATRGGELERAGEKWDYAFVDFQLEDHPGYTGFGALDYLHTFSPTTKVIVFTSLGEKGRTLFALAAREWFNAWTVLDKRSASNEALRNVAAGVEPSPQWQRYLARSSVINEFFKKESSLRLWKLFAFHGGTQSAICKAGKLGPNRVREFGKDAAGVVASIKRQIPLIDTSADGAPGVAAAVRRGNDPVAVPVVGFYRAHHNFFEAPELPDILETVEPWRRPTR